MISILNILIDLTIGSYYGKRFRRIAGLAQYSSQTARQTTG
jgi:hypothetical protein